MTEKALREAIVETCRRMNALGINQGKSGNVSARLGESAFLVTPSGMAYDVMRPEDVVRMTMAGEAGAAHRPSSEWRIHRDVLLARPEVGAIVHAHPIRATALACHGRPIPPFHYMVAVAGGADVRCAPYATFGTEALSKAAVEALDDRRACLLAHHGILALGHDPGSALDLAVEIETLAAMYLEAARLGEPPLLDDAEMARVLEAFRTYGGASARK
jgi:L-fuculose-phosphate aldolase